MKNTPFGVFYPFGVLAFFVETNLNTEDLWAEI